jgi:hypothetical protein
MFAHRAQESNRAAAGTVLEFTCFKQSYFTISAANNSTLWRQPLDGLLTTESWLSGESSSWVAKQTALASRPTYLALLMARAPLSTDPCRLMAACLAQAAIHTSQLRISKTR